MSRFATAVEAIRGPLDFARKTVDRAAAADLPQTLAAALRQPMTLRIPPRAQKRFEAAAALVAERGLERDVVEALRKRLGAVLAPEYAQTVLGQATEVVPGVGPRTAAALAKKEILTVEDLVMFLPRIYEDRRERTSIADLKVGHPAVFEGTISRAGVVPVRKGRRFFQAVVSDGEAAVTCKWFRGLAHFEGRLRPGQRVLVAGDVRRYRYAKELHHPEIETLGEGDDDAEVGSRIVPVYSAVEGVPPRTLRRIVEGAVGYAADLVEAWLPAVPAAALGLPELGDSIVEVHHPGPHLDPEELRARRTTYHRRLICEELFLLQLGLALRRTTRARRTTRRLDVDAAEVADAIAALPFQLTPDQIAAWDEIRADLGRPRPMHRLLVGDVGTGKTVLAVLGAVAAHASQGLTAVLAPTEILAEQHDATFRALAGPLGLRTALLTGSTPVAERRSLARLTQLGEIHIVVGTHALLSGTVALPRLRFVVIDEQHRFGVAQRLGLPSKGENPHVLVMSATPIPRTLALTVFGDLDHTTLRNRPPGRAPVATEVVPGTAGRRVFDAVKETLARDEQVYVVYPLVEESEKQDLQDASRGFERLQRALPGVAVGLLHGRMEARERVRVMKRFGAGEIRVLVSTTVIEVGVDVANATLLVVQHAERFGLAQLHQLRGRVGRAEKPGRAILIGDPKTEDASRRLAILEASASGFDIAEEDLRIRGAGEWLGTRQAGHLPELRLADLVRHGELLEPAREAATALLTADPGLVRHPRMRAALERRWGRRLDFGAVA